MTTFLGFDADRVNALRRAMRAALDELDSLRCDDPAVPDASVDIRGVQHLLRDRWIGIVDGLALATLYDYRVAAAQGLDVLTAQTANTHDHLAVSLGDTALVDRFEALATARLFAAADLAMHPNDPAWQARVAQLDAAIATMTALCEVAPTSAGNRFTFLDRLDPYAAALALRTLELNDHELSSLVGHLLRRWHDGNRVGDGPLTGWRDQSVRGANPADIAMPLLSARPAAALEFLRQSTDRPELVLGSAESEATVEALLTAALSPSMVNAHEAGAVLRPLLDWTFGEGGRVFQPFDMDTADPKPALAAAVTPWLLEFRPRANEWGWTPAEGDRILRLLLSDDAAMQRLIASLDMWRANAATVHLRDADGRLDARALEDIAEMFSQLHLALRDAAIDQRSANRFWVDLTVMAAQQVASGIVFPEAGPLGSFVASQGVGLGTDGAVAALDQFGLLPESRATAAAAEQVHFGDRTADTAVAMVVAVVGELIAAGKLPSNSLDQLDLHDAGAGSRTSWRGCRAEEVAARLRRFVGGLTAQLDPADANLLWAVTNTFASPATIDQTCTP